MDFVIVALLVLLLIHVHRVWEGQQSPKHFPKRPCLVYTMVQFDTLNGSIFGPFHCSKSIELDFIPQVGADFEVNDLGTAQQVYRVYHTESGFFSLGLTKHTFSDWQEGDEPTEEKFQAWLERNGWSVSKRMPRDWEEWPEFKPTAKFYKST